MENVNREIEKEQINLEKKTLTVSEFQQVMGLGYQNAMELVHRNDFPKITVGRRILIIESKIDPWIENNIGLSI